MQSKPYTIKTLFKLYIAWLLVFANSVYTNSKFLLILSLICIYETVLAIYKIMK